MIVKNLPLLMDLSYKCYQRGLIGGDLVPERNIDGSIKKTFCNTAINFICSGMGYTKFTGMMANEMFDFMSKPENGWISVDEAVSQQHANIGVLTLASMKNPQGHGHICLILPGLLDYSSSWGKNVPKCMNIGKDVFYGKKLSFAFTPAEMPTIFCLSEMI